MRIDVAFTPAELRGAAGRGIIVVIDVLRATSTIVEALVNGARSVVPVATVEDAVRRATEIGRDSVLLCGERDAEPIRGFDLGNSPLEFTPERVGGRTLVMSTTNGTAALMAASGAGTCLVGALSNAGAVAQRLIELGGDALLLCAGREHAFALEDAMCAGRIAQQVRARVRGVRGNDALYAALRLGRTAPTAELLGRTAAGRRLREIGREEDVTFCALENRRDAVPVLDGHRIRL